MTSPAGSVPVGRADGARGEGISHARGQAAVENGHQTSVVTTRRDLSIETVALRMFSRWQQENFFRYMRHEFALDHLPSTAVEPADPERSVPNPAVTEKKRELGQVTAQLAKAEQASGSPHDTAAERRTVRGCTISHASWDGRSRTCARRGQLDAELTALPARVPRETMNGEPIVLASGRSSPT